MTSSKTITFAAILGALGSLAEASTTLAEGGDTRALGSTQRDSLQYKVETPSSGILRLWAKQGEEAFTRVPSLAMEKAPLSKGQISILETHGIRSYDTEQLTLKQDTQTGTFSIYQGGQLLIDKLNFRRSGETETWELEIEIAPEEKLLGLGQDNQNGGRLDRRGVRRELWSGQKINSGNVTAEYPIPLLISTGREGLAYGLFFDNAHRLVFDLGKTESGKVHVASDGGEADLYILSGPSVKEVVKKFALLTGKPSLPPLWALGYWQSKCTYYDWSQLDEAYQQLNTRGFPVDAMVIDYDWPEVANNFEWAARWKAGSLSPKEKIADYAAKGVHIVMSQSGPMVRQESPTFKTGWEAGIFASDGKGNPVECGHYGGKLLDFTHPSMNDWLWPQVSQRNQEGVSGWWLDLTEPEGEPPETHYHGGRPSNVHNEYSLLCSRSFEGVQLQDQPNQRPFILTRSASAGSQRHHVSVWTGDVYSDYATLRAHPSEMLNSGLSGLTWWTSDSGGFMNGYYKDDQMGAHARLYERWMQFSVFSPITRAHKAGGVPEPYQFGPAVEQSCLHYLKLRYQLMPYIYSFAWEASQTGIPLVRPLGLEYPDEPGVWASKADQYLFGNSLLVAPVMREGVRNREVYFPKGRWFDWDTSVEYTGGRSWVVPAPQNRIPVAVRSGAIIPMAPDMKYTAEKPWDPLTLHIWPAEHSSFTLYQDDGRSFDYRNGSHTLTRFTAAQNSKELDVRINESNKRYSPARYAFKLHLDRCPSHAEDAEGQQLKFEWDDSTRVMELTLLADQAKLSHGFKVTYTGQLLPAKLAKELELDNPDENTEKQGSLGKPVPHFFPPPSLPARIKAVNYDKGGEGVAFHSTRPLLENGLYRNDTFSIETGTDSEGGLVLGGLQPSEWLRYTVDCQKGGWFELSLRIANGQSGGRLRLLAHDRLLSSVELPNTGGNDVWKDIRVPAIYLNPGEISLMLYVDLGGFRLNHLDLRRVAPESSRLPAILMERAGFADIATNGGPEQGPAIKNLGRIGSRLTGSLWSQQGGAATLVIHCKNASGKSIPLRVSHPDGTQTLMEVGTQTPEWQYVPVQTQCAAGSNAVSIEGLLDGYEGLLVNTLELVKQQ